MATPPAKKTLLSSLGSFFTKNTKKKQTKNNLYSAPSLPISNMPMGTGILEIGKSNSLEDKDNKKIQLLRSLYLQDPDLFYKYIEDESTKDSILEIKYIDNVLFNIRESLSYQSFNIIYKSSSHRHMPNNYKDINSLLADANTQLNNLSMYYTSSDNIKNNKKESVVRLKITSSSNTIKNATQKKITYRNITEYLTQLNKIFKTEQDTDIDSMFKEHIKQEKVNNKTNINPTYMDLNMNTPSDIVITPTCDTCNTSVTYYKSKLFETKQERDYKEHKIISISLVETENIHELRDLMNALQPKFRISIGCKFTDLKLIKDNKDINDKMQDILYKIAFVLQSYKNIHNYVEILNLYMIRRLELENINNDNYFTRFFDECDEGIYFDFKNKKVIKFCNICCSIDSSKDKGKYMYNIGKCVHIIDIVNIDSYEYTFLSLNESYTHSKIFANNNFNFSCISAFLESIGDFENLKKFYNERKTQYKDIPELNLPYYEQRLQLNDFIKYEYMLKFRTAKETYIKEHIGRSSPNNLLNPIISEAYKAEDITQYNSKEISITDNMIKDYINTHQAYLFHKLLNIVPFNTFINNDEIYNIDITNDSPPLNEDDKSYEDKFTFTIENNNYNDNNVFKNIVKFLNSKYIIFVGFINLKDNNKEHKNMFIIDKTRKLLIRFEPKGTAASKTSSFDSLSLTNDFKEYLANVYKNFIKTAPPEEKIKIDAIDFIDFILGHDTLYKYINTATIERISFKKKKNILSTKYRFAQEHDSIKKLDDNHQTYTLCAALLYSMNTTLYIPPISLGEVDKQKNEKINNENKNILILSEIAITTERAEAFRLYLKHKTVFCDNLLSLK